MIPARDERGFSLIELLTVMALMAVLVTLGAFAFRHYWFVRSLYGAQDQTMTVMRQAQEQAVSESHPLIYGVRFDVGTSHWIEVRYNPGDASITTDDVCKTSLADSTSASTVHSFDSGVKIASASFASASGLDETKCPRVPGVSKFAFFYAKGTATAGSVTFTQPQLGDNLSLTVSGLTGRVKKS